MDYKAKSRLDFVTATLASNMFAIFIFYGLMAALLVELSEEFGTTVPIVAQLITITAVTWGLLAPLIGPLSDRVGHKRMLTFGLVIFSASLLGYSLSNSVLALIVSSILAGMSGAIVGPNILASVADNFSVETYGRGMSAVNTAIPLAYLVGVPLVVLIAGGLGWRWSFVSLSGFVLASALAVVIFLPPIRPTQSDKDRAYLSSFREALREKTFLPTVLANTIFQAAYWAIAAYLAAFLIRSYALSTSQLAPLISAMAVGQLIGMLAGGPLADRFNKTRICAVTSALLGTTGLVLMLFARNMWLSVLMGGLYMGFYGSNRPAYLSLMALVSSTVRGTVMGIQAVSNHIGRALGTAIAGLLLGLMGYNYLGVLCLVLSVLASAIYLFVYFSLHKSPDGTGNGW
jgi:predicted MFS family arabinose efflux permease